LNQLSVLADICYSCWLKLHFSVTAWPCMIHLLTLSLKSPLVIEQYMNIAT